MNSCTVESLLAALNWDYQVCAMPDGRGMRFDLTSGSYSGLIINVFKTDTVNVQGGRGGKGDHKEDLKNLLDALCAVMARC